MFTMQAGPAFANGLAGNGQTNILLNLDACLEQAAIWAKSTGRLGRHGAMAAALSDEAWAKSWPRLNVRAGARYETRDGNILPEADGDFGETFLELPQNVARRRIAELGVAGAALLEARELCVAQARAIRAYTAFLRSDARLNMAEEQMFLADEIEYAWSMAPDDPSLAERRAEALTQARNRPLLLEQAQMEQASAAKRLFTICNLAGTDALVTVAAIHCYDAPPPVSLERCVAWATANRGDLLAMREQERAQKVAVRLARMARLPSPALGFGYRDSSDVDSDNAFQGLYIKAMLKAPIWDAGEISAQVKKLSAERTRTLTELDDLEAGIAASVARAYGAWRRAEEAYFAVTHAADDSQDLLRKANIRRALGDLSENQYRTEVLRANERQWSVIDAALACHEAEAELLEAVQAGREDLRAGLKESK